MLKACQEEGVEVTREQLEAAEAYQEKELSEDDLDNVTGGSLGLALFVAVAVITYWWYVRSYRR